MEEGKSGFISNHLLYGSRNAKPGVQTCGDPQGTGETLQATVGSSVTEPPGLGCALAGPCNTGVAGPLEAGPGPGGAQPPAGSWPALATFIYCLGQFSTGLRKAHAATTLALLPLPSPNEVG